MSRTGACPSCGSPLTFEVGSSRAAVCRFCNTLVVRRGQDFASVGKVADLVPTGAHVAVGASGRYLGERFTVQGRLQLEWQQGVWDEWYVSFPDERWGWLAEAQGRYYISFRVEGITVPPSGALRPGESIELGRHGRFVVTDIKYARVVAAEGELPEDVDLEGAVHTVDLEGQGGTFATIDHGAEGDSPTLFVGRQVPLGDLALSVPEEAKHRKVVHDAESIVCGNCGSPVTLHAPAQTVRLVCRSCSALIEPAAGAARVVQVLSRHREDPPIAIGERGVLRGTEWMAIGWMRRICVVEGLHYRWDEVLLHQPNGTAMAWLIRNDGHWSFARAIPAAEVLVYGGTAMYKDRSYKRFSSVLGQVEEVLGEFTWAVEVGEYAELEDFVSPPEGLSLERNHQEINWSHVEHLEPAEVEAAFRIPEDRRERKFGVGTVEPWPFAGPMAVMKSWMIAGAVAVCLLFGFFAMRQPQKVITHSFSTVDVPVVESGEAPAPSRLRTFVSEPVAISGLRSLEVNIDTNVDNAWAFVGGALIHEESGEAAFFGLEAAYYHGYDDGEAWKDGRVSQSQELSSPRGGSYIVRADLEWDPAALGEPTVTLEIREGGYSGGQFLLALSVILSPLLLLLHRRSFEKRRWEQSNLIG